MRTFGQTNVEEKNGQPLMTPDMDGRFYQTVTAVPAIVLEENPKSADVKRSTYPLCTVTRDKWIEARAHDDVCIH